MPILQAAAQAGVAFPSESLAALGYRPEFNANKLADFVSHFSVAATHNEEGQPLSESRVSLAHEPVEEDDLELTYRESSVGARVLVSQLFPNQSQKFRPRMPWRQRAEAGGR